MIRGGQVTLKVGDVERAVRFYVETLGMKLVAEEGGAAVIDAGEGFLLRLETSTPSVDLRPKVPLDEAIAILENRGVSITRTPDGLAHLQDPDGNPLTLRP